MEDKLFHTIYNPSTNKEFRFLKIPIISVKVNLLACEFFDSSD